MLAARVASSCTVVVAQPRTGRSLMCSRPSPQTQGTLPLDAKFDLFADAAVQRVVEKEHYVNTAGPIIKFGKKSHAECARFSPDGQFLASGDTRHSSAMQVFSALLAVQRLQLLQPSSCSFMACCVGNACACLC